MLQRRPSIEFRDAFVRGRYTEALALDAVRPAPTRLVAQALLHLGREGEALDLVRRRGVRRIPPGLRQRADRPLRTSLAAPATLPFADHQLAPYLPAVEATLNGTPVLAHLDTGAPFVATGTARAAALGIDLTPIGRHYHGTTRTTVHVGIASELRLGPATLTNVPVTATPTLTGAQDVVIIGTNVLQQFLATIDNPGGELRLAPRGTPPPPGAPVPFGLWDDHYLFARGGLGARDDCTWFVDSGLVYLIASDDGAIRQASLTTTAALYRTFGITASGPHFEAPAPLRLGPLSQDHPFVSTAPRRVPWSSFGGIRIDGLLSHGFLKRYAWTLDFDRSEFIIAE